MNKTNPVVVWTDGASLFFAPAARQVTSGRMVTTPEPTFSPPAGYVAEELHWDRTSAKNTGGDPLVVVARKPGAPDLDVIVSNTLRQRFSFSGTLGLKGGATAAVTRDGAEFLAVDDTSVPVDLSGAGTKGAIHRKSFADGFLRYRASSGSHDLYVGQGASPSAYLVERATGNISRTFASGTIASIVPETSGVVHIELTTTRGTRTTRSTVTIDLRSSPPGITTATAHTSAEPGYAATRARLEAVGVTFEEVGVRMRVAELEAIEEALSLGANRGLNSLIEFRRRFGSPTTDPVLEVFKSIGSDYGGGLAAPGSGTPSLFISEPFADTATRRVATIRHEMTHIIMGAVDAVSRASMTARQRADLEGAARYEARRALRKARKGLLRAGEYGAGDRTPPAGTASSWRSIVGDNPHLAAIWVELLRRYSFIPDPEGTREFRGVSLADESRYSGTSERVGHPADAIGEFVASFVTSARLFRAQFMAAVLDAEAAGNAHGGGGGSYVRSLYRRAWDIIDTTYVPLGSNPW